METGITVLDHTVLVLHPHEHMVRVEDVLAYLPLIILAEAQGIAAIWVRLSVDGLEDVLGVVLEHLLGLCGQLARVVLVLLMQFLVRCCAVLGQGRRVHGVTVGGLIDTIHRRTSCHDALIWPTGLEPNTTRNSVRNLGLGRSRGDWSFRVLNQLVTLSGHPAGLVVRRNFLEERRHQLDVSVSDAEGAERSLDQAVEGARHEAVGLAEHDNLVATIVRERLDPNTVLLVRAGCPGVLLAQFVLPGDALFAGAECERALATITAD